MVTTQNFSSQGKKKNVKIKEEKVSLRHKFHVFMTFPIRIILILTCKKVCRLIYDHRS